MNLFKLEYVAAMLVVVSLDQIVGQPWIDEDSIDQLISLDQNKSYIQETWSSDPIPHPPQLQHWKSSNTHKKPNKIPQVDYTPEDSYLQDTEDLFNFECGLRFLGKGRKGRRDSSSYRFVAGGYTVRPYRYPSYVKLTVKVNDIRELTCGGTLISRQFVLTAAHCFREGVIQLDVDSTIYQNPSRAYARMSGVKVCSLSHYEGDISVVRLLEPVEFSRTLQPACLPDYPLNSTNQAISVGLGATDITNGVYTDAAVLQALPVKRLPCRLKDRSFGSICFQPNLEEFYGDTCVGDSGGPTYGSVNGRLVVYGVTSRGYSSNCQLGELGYSVSGDVFRLKSQIIDLMKECN